MSLVEPEAYGVLLVENDEDIRAVMKLSLDEYPPKCGVYKVYETPTYDSKTFDEAKHQLGGKIHCAVIDYRLESGQMRLGSEVAYDIVNRSQNNTRIVIASARTFSQKELERFIGEGWRLVQKPFHVVDFADTVSSAVLEAYRDPEIILPKLNPRLDGGLRKNFKPDVA